MKKITICNKTFKIESWWRWVSVDKNGEVCIFFNEPRFEYWNRYEGGRFWDVSPSTTEWQQIGLIDVDMFSGAFLMRLV